MAGCGLNPWYNGFFKNTLKITTTSVIGCTDKTGEPTGVKRFPKDL
jgi:hypothetical protein